MSSYEKINDADHGLFGDGTNILAVEDPESYINSPSQKYGNKLTIPIMISFIIFSCVVVAMLMWCSKRQEAKKKSKLGAREERRESIRNSVVSKAFVPADVSDSVDKASEATGPASDVEEARSVVTDNTDAPVFQRGECALCSQQLGDDPSQIYESNNPGCNHCFHAQCMDKWLQLQNTCPTCNQPFAILKV